MSNPKQATMTRIADVVRRWQAGELSDRQALMEIDKISIAEQKREWDEAHAWITDFHDDACEAELTSHGYTPCRCQERKDARPHYAIKNVLGDLWLAPNRKWLAKEHAITFDFITTANMYATLGHGLGLDEFTVEQV